MKYLSRARREHREARNNRPRIIAMYEDVLGAGPAKSLADCQTKNTYSSTCAAEGAATLLGWAGGLDLEPYRCPWCDEYHLRHRRSA